MSSSALEAQGMVIQRGAVGSPESPLTYTTIPEVTSISGPDGSASEIDVSDLSSTAKEFRMGLKDSGSVTLEFMYIPGNTVHANLRSDWSARTLTPFKLIFTDSPETVWYFDGYVQNFSTSAAVDAALAGSMTIRISGDITEA